MTITPAVCAACRDIPVHDVYVCQRCMDDLHGHLHAVPELTKDLRIEAAKLARHGHGPATFTPTVERPLPVNLAAAGVLRELRKVLAVASVALRSGVYGSIPAMAAWLIEHEDVIAGDPDGGTLCARLAEVMRRARRVIDNPPERIYIGRCDCTLDGGEHPRLYARAGERWHQCPDCETVHDASRKWEDLQASLADYGLTRQDIKTLLPQIPPKTLDNWIDRAPVKLHRLGISASGDPTYRYGDVLALDARRREWRKRQAT